MDTGHLLREMFNAAIVSDYSLKAYKSSIKERKYTLQYISSARELLGIHAPHVRSAHHVSSHRGASHDGRDRKRYTPSNNSYGRNERNSGRFQQQKK